MKQCIYGLALFSLFCGSIGAMEVKKSDLAKSLANYFRNRVLEHGGSQKAADRLAELIVDEKVTMIYIKHGITCDGNFRAVYSTWLDEIKDSEQELYKKASIPVLSGFLPGDSIFRIKEDRVSYSRVRGSNWYYINQDGQLVNEKTGEIEYLRR